MYYNRLAKEHTATANDYALAGDQAIKDARHAWFPGWYNTKARWNYIQAQHYYGKAADARAVERETYQTIKDEL